MRLKKGYCPSCYNKLLININKTTATCPYCGIEYKTDNASKKPPFRAIKETKINKQKMIPKNIVKTVYSHGDYIDLGCEKTDEKYVFEIFIVDSNDNLLIRTYTTSTHFDILLTQKEFNLRAKIRCAIINEDKKYQELEYSDFFVSGCFNFIPKNEEENNSSNREIPKDLNALMVSITGRIVFASIMMMGAVLLITILSASLLPSENAMAIPEEAIEENQSNSIGIKISINDDGDFYVSKISEHAKQYGLKLNDYVVSVDGKVLKSINDIDTIRMEHDMTQPYDFVIIRDDKTINIKIDVK